jgi:hypothetical protein
MKRSWVGLISLAVLASATAAQAQQYPMQIQRQLPTYQQPAGGPNGNGTMGWAPWLNLLNSTGFSGSGTATGGGAFGNAIPGAGVAVQYFGITRPEQQSMQTFNQLQGQVNRIQTQAQVAPPRNQGIADTGVPARFMSYGGYFGNAMQQRTLQGGGR